MAHDRTRSKSLEFYDLNLKTLDFLLEKKIIFYCVVVYDTASFFFVISFSLCIKLHLTSD